jgi:hypothetical protein
VKNRNYYFKKFLPKLLLWALFCGFFGLLFVLARVRIYPIGMTTTFIFIWCFFLFCAALFSLLFNGGLNIFKINVEHKNSRIFNKHIINGKIDVKISDEELKKVFNALKEEPVVVFGKIFIYTGLEVLFSFLTITYIGFSWFTVVVVLIGGFISMMILALFSLFFTENFFSNLLMQARKLLSERKIEYSEDIQSFTLKNRFHYFVVLLFLVVVVFLSFIPSPDYFVLTILSLALILALIVSKMLFESIYSSFREIKEFVMEIPKEKKAVFFTGSSYKEIINLSNFLNESSDQIYESREREKKSQEELQRKIDELSKWRKLTIGRELKMVELKRKIETLEGEIKKIKKDKKK